MSDSAVVDTPVEAPSAEKSKPKRQPPYAIIVLNDDLHTFDYVIRTFMKIFKYELQKCIKLAKDIHEKGQTIVWSGTLELAELKRDQLASAGPDLYSGKKVDFPLRTRLEPLR